MTPADFALIGIDSQTIQYCFIWGFSAITGSFLTGYVILIALKLIKIT